jgi:hypothetical protein
MPGLELDERAQTLTWDGRAQGVGFWSTVAGDHPPGNALGVVTVMVGGVPVGRIKFTVRIVKAAPGRRAAELQPAGQASPFTMAFLSYARQDLEKVTHYAEILEALGVSYFHDVLSIRRGARWEKTMYSYIDRCDLFLLFWSNPAKRSKWVRKEVKYALERKRDDDLAPPALEPIIIEGPPVPLPWKEVAHLQFDDLRIYRAAAISQR